MGARGGQWSGFLIRAMFQNADTSLTFSPASQRTLGMAAHPVQYIRLHVRYGGRSNEHAGESI
jgi:hypothetical protein